MSWLCKVTRYIYGYSGNELMPPVEREEYFIYLSEDDEDLETFKIRMQDTVLPMRRAAKAASPRHYSITDGWDWSILDITPKPMPPIEELYPK
jgi:hypothetical protein